MKTRALIAVLLILAIIALGIWTWILCQPKLESPLPPPAPPFPELQAIKSPPPVPREPVKEPVAAKTVMATNAEPVPPPLPPAPLPAPEPPKKEIKVKTDDYFYGRLKGQIIKMQNNKPINKASLIFDMPDQPSAPLLQSSVRMGTNGQFNVRVSMKPSLRDELQLEPADSIQCQLIASAPGFITAMLGEDSPLVLARGQTISNLVIALEPADKNTAPGSLEGFVYSGKGKPVPSFPVGLKAKSDRFAANILQSLTDGKGFFKFNNLKPGFYWLSIDSPTKSGKELLKQVKITAGQTTSVICNLPLPGVLTVDLVDESGRPYYAGCRVTINDKLQCSMFEEDIFRGQARYTLQADEGIINILFAGNDGRAGELAACINSGEEIKSTVVMQKARGGSVLITGTVMRSYDLIAIQNANATATILKVKDGFDLSGPLPGAITDADGRFEFPVPLDSEKQPLPISVSVSHPDYCDYSCNLILEPGKPIAPLKIYLQNGAGLHIIVTDRNGRPFPTANMPENTSISANVKAQGGHFHATQINKRDAMQTMSTLAFEFSNIQPGKAVISIHYGDKHNETTAELKDNATTTVSIQMPE